VANKRHDVAEPRGSMQTARIGTAGEYYVAGQLSERGWHATITIKNAQEIDVLAKHVAQGVAISVQLKATRGKQGWMLGVKNEAPTALEHEWYILVALRGPDERPDFYMLPRSQVAARVWFLGTLTSITSRRIDRLERP
jgi:hypothetical protein